MRAISMSDLKCVVVTIAFCVACFESHSADDSDPEQESVVSESFDPFSGKLKEDDSAAEQLWWRYRVNRGKPVTMSSDKSTIIEFDDQLTTVDPSNSTRVTTLKANIRSSDNSVSGTMTMEGTENLELGQTTRVVSQRAIVKLDIEEDGETTNGVRDLLSEMDPPVEWVLDRTDLDESETGSVLLQQTYNMRFSGSEDATRDGRKLTRPVNEHVAAVTDTWTVVKKHESLSVQGTDYQNVVEIERETSVSDTEVSEGGVMTYNYCVAKGVGVIKTTSVIPFSDLSDGIPIELVDTNLVQ